MRISILFIFVLFVGLFMAGCVGEIKSVSVEETSYKNNLYNRNNMKIIKNNSSNNNSENIEQNISKEQVLSLVNIQTNHVTLNVQNYY